MYLLILFLSLHVSCNPSQPGCTDPLAANFDSSATEDDNSCLYDTIYISPLWSVELSEQINETSGLIIWNEALWTINDNSNTRLYELDATSGEIVADYLLPDVENRDWEEIAQDKDYVYVGDFGNNLGIRTDLHILRIEKLTLTSDDPSIDTIWFSFGDQQNFDPVGTNQTEFDCEAFVVSSDSIYLFTKQWTSGFTTQYSLSKLPGTHIAQNRNVFNIRGQVTGATFLEGEGLLTLCGYSGLVQPFLYIFYDYPGYDFFAGTKKRVNLSLPFHQVEGVATINGFEYYVTNESSSFNQVARIPQKLHFIDLDHYLD